MPSGEPDKDITYFARTDYRNADKIFGIKRTDRRQHAYVIGKTGTGKSALLHNLIMQDISNGEGVCVVDPHGELIEGLLDKIPEERLDDVIYFNPADPDYHIGLNVLELPDPRHKNLVASGLMGIFTKIWANAWSARMEYILNNAILALIETPGSTLLGINRILVDKDFRQKIIANVTDPVVKAFWIHEYEQWRDQFRNEAIAPIQNKVGQFLSTDTIRNVVGQSKSTIDIFDLMNTGKIFLVNVSKGRIGEDNSALLGSMLITRIQLATMERVRVPEDERVDFYLYVDEFQNFATDSFAGILSEARKYRLNLTLAHQYIGQLVTGSAGSMSGTSTKVRDAVFGNVGTMIVFRVGAADAEFLESEFEPEFTIQDMVNLPNWHIYLKIMTNGISSRPFSARTLPPFKTHAAAAAKEQIIQGARKRYARPRYVVEEEIKRWSGMMSGEPIPTAPETRKPAPPLPSGTLRPPTGPRPRPQAPRAPSQSLKHIQSLSELGIEFAPTPQTPAPQPSPAAARHTPPAQPPPPRKETPPPSALAALPFEPEPPATLAPLQLETLPVEPQKGEGASKTLSLKDLKPKEKTPKHKHGGEDVNIAGIRDTIKETLHSYIENAGKDSGEGK